MSELNTDNGSRITAKSPEHEKSFEVALSFPIPVSSVNDLCRNLWAQETNGISHYKINRLVSIRNSPLIH